MSIADYLFTTAKDMLMMSENIKRLESRLDTITSDMASIDRRVIKIELMVELSRQPGVRRLAKEIP